MRVLSPALFIVVGCLASCGGQIDATPPADGAADAGPGNSGDANGVGATGPDGGASNDLMHDIFLPVGGVDIALDDSALYVFDDIGQVTRVDKASGATRALVAHPATGEHVAVALCGDSVFWVDVGWARNSGRILSVPKNGGELQVFKDGLYAPAGIACDDTTVYWPEAGTAQENVFDGAIAAAPLAGGDRVVLTDHEGWAIRSVAVTDDAVIFASNLADGVEIRRIAKTGGEVTTLSSAPGATSDIEIAGDYVVWTATTGAFYAPVAGGDVTKVGDWPTQDLTFTGEHFVYEVADPGPPFARIERAAPGGDATEIGRAIHAGGRFAAVSDASGAYLMDVHPGYGTTVHVVAR